MMFLFIKIARSSKNYCINLWSYKPVVVVIILLAAAAASMTRKKIICYLSTDSVYNKFVEHKVKVSSSLQVFNC
jgi:hypothetical protein